MIRVYRGLLTTWSSLDQMSTEPVAMGIFNAAAPHISRTAQVPSSCGFRIPFDEGTCWCVLNLLYISRFPIDFLDFLRFLRSSAKSPVVYDIALRVNEVATRLSRDDQRTRANRKMDCCSSNQNLRTLLSFRLLLSLGDLVEIVTKCYGPESGKGAPSSLGVIYRLSSSAIRYRE
jgi:hypothetical protein